MSYKLNLIGSNKKPKLFPISPNSQLKGRSVRKSVYNRTTCMGISNITLIKDKKQYTQKNKFENIEQNKNNEYV